MSAQIIPFDPHAPRRNADATAAWEAYDAAQQHAMALYSDPLSTSHERLTASVKAMRLHAVFVRAFGGGQ